MNNFFKNIKSKLSSGGFHASKTLNPHKHWKVLLWIFFGVAVFLVVFSLYILYQIKNAPISQAKTAAETPPSLLKEQLIKNVTESFNKKAEKESELLTTPPPYKDPSL